MKKKERSGGIADGVCVRVPLLACGFDTGKEDGQSLAGCLAVRSIYSATEPPIPAIPFSPSNSSLAKAISANLYSI